MEVTPPLGHLSVCCSMSSAPGQGCFSFLLSVSLGTQLLEGRPLSYEGLYPTPSTDLANTLLCVCMRDKDNKNDNSISCQCLLGALTNEWAHLILTTALEVGVFSHLTDG